ncbi:MAG: OmpA family protein, partial [Rhodospirillaceae bacterium]|nr:OmpA family protein [Rhodospirillaceae bacterium]
MRKTRHAHKIILATFSSLGLIVLLLSGCSGAAVEKVRDLNVSHGNGAAFEAALADEYRTLALFEADRMGDTSDARRYAGKALRAALGDVPEPDRALARVLPDGSVDNVNAQRRRLLSVGGQVTNPRAAARARVGFDCWLEQLEENFQPTHIAACRSSFTNALAEAEAILPRAFVTFFDHNSIRLKGDGVDAAARAARIAQQADGFEVLITGHADRTGTPGHNLRLSDKRANVVRRQLIAYG